MDDDRRYACPTCGASVRYHAASCPACDADLSTVAKLSEMPDALFNAALVAAGKEQWVEAIGNLSAAVHLRGDDAASWRLMGKLYGHLGSDKSAELCFAIAMMHQRAAADRRGAKKGNGQNGAGKSEEDGMKSLIDKMKEM